MQLFFCDWKLIQLLDGSKKLELYNLKDDIGEKTNLADKFQGRKADLPNKLQCWQNNILAKIPIHNPSYDPKRVHEW